MRESNLHRLTIKHMQALDALEQEDSISKAASALGISQPALSNRLREIERLSNNTCFHRKGNRLSFTQSGLVLLNTAQIVLEELRRAEDYLKQFGMGGFQIIRLETRGYLLDFWLAPVLSRFMANSPGVLVETSCNGDKLPLENLLTGRVDVTVTMGDSQRNGVERDFLLEDELVAVLPAEHPLVHREYLAAEDFREETLLGISSILERGQEFDHLFGPSGAAPERFLSAGNAQFVCALVANDTGLGILGKWAASYDIRKYGLKTVRLTRAGLKVNWHAAFAESGTQRGETAALILAMKQSLAREDIAP